ncbi:flagellar basal body P-ring protein FlgI [Desulfofustis limnaeus]|uniref:Flagellar P-ring protein n=1 Tax=Desulfofustis limnaeus TaxID=2740163 RepID=A0ABM7W8Q6_9BACT|nr:flagellar basal body P-ring protein FlgI [Desulfofustis limnaeus]BDD87357.1 flagellar P-ring protein [Desulfofustis limnaeus]
MKRLFPASLSSLLLLLLVLFLVVPASAARLKDIARLNGVRSNSLIGYGLVTGLNGTGDDMKKSYFTLQAIYNLMVRSGITADPQELANIKLKNVAAVMVTAELPPFARPGSTIDVEVSSIGDAKSISGGTLLMTPLKGADGQVYAVAQGAVTNGAFAFGGKAATVQKNHPTSGRIANGAKVEKEVAVDLGSTGMLQFQLDNADFTTAANITEQINALYGPDTAFPADSGTIQVAIPELFRDSVVLFVSELEGIDVEPDATARVVVNERTGTIVMGRDVKLSTVAVSHGNLSLVIDERADVYQPNPFTDDAQAVAVPRTDVTLQEDEGQLTVLNMEEGVSIGDIATALNAIGATPRDLIAIFQAIKAAGSLHGDLIVL